MPSGEEVSKEDGERGHELQEGKRQGKKSGKEGMGRGGKGRGGGKMRRKRVFQGLAELEVREGHSLAKSPL